MKTPNEPERRPTLDSSLEDLKKQADTLSNTEWAARTQELARAAFQPEQPAPLLSHTECQALLELYVNDEQEGQDVELLYPAVWYHLQSCDECTLVYHQLQEALSELKTEPAEQTSPPVRYSPFASPKPGERWHTRLASQLLGNKRQLTFLFSLNHILNVLSPPQLALRSTGETTEKALLFEPVQVGNEHVIVKANLVPALNGFNLHLTVVPEESEEMNWRAHLKWGENEYHQDLYDGEGVIENLSPPPTTGPASDTPSPNFSLTVEPIPDERIQAD